MTYFFDTNILLHFLRGTLGNDSDWTKQITPWQFLPPKSGKIGDFKPAGYATKLMHL